MTIASVKTEIETAGRFAMLSRPSDDGHTPFGDVFYSESPDLTYWGRHRHVLGTVPNSWQSTASSGRTRRTT